MSEKFSCLHYVSEVRFELGGVVQAVVDLCEALSARGHRVTLVTCDAKDVPQAWKESDEVGPKVIEIEPSSLTKKRISSAGLQDFQKALEGIDLVHLHTPWDLGNFQLIPILSDANIPYIVTVHGMLDDWCMDRKALKKQVFLKVMGKKLFEQATTVHLTAESEFEQASRWVPIDSRKAVQCYALDLSAYDPLPGPGPALKAFPQIDPDRLKILFLSRLHPKKGVEFLLQAGALLKERGLPIQLLIAGPGDAKYVQSLKTLMSSLSLDKETEFLGMVHGVEKRSLFQLADAFALPTYQENFGLVIAEAMACGTPVVTTKGTDIWQEISAGGARIADLNPESIAGELQELFGDMDECRKIGERGYHFVRDWLDRDNVTSGYEEMYLQTIERGAQKV